MWKKREEAKRVMGFKRHGSNGIYIGGSKGYSYRFNMQSVSLGRIQWKIPPEKKSLEYCVWGKKILWNWGKYKNEMSTGFVSGGTE